MIKLYGIPNCDTVKKARKWLDNNNVKYQFHDFKKQGIDETTLKKWSKKLGWDVVLNRRGTTWRKLPDSVKNNIDNDSAIKVMLDNPSIIKRPVLVKGAMYHVGFKEQEYKELLG